MADYRIIGIFLFLFLFTATVRAAEPSTAAIKRMPDAPVLYIIGDSTVHNTGKGLMGWGDCIDPFFDTDRIVVQNHAMGGRSSRTFMTEGRWDKVLETLKPGDFVLMQFGHNDGGAINDNQRARATLKGIGEETQEIDNILTKKHEVVHTYGWYMRKYVTDAKAKGATPIVCTLVPRNDWKEGKVSRSVNNFGQWAQQVAEQEKVPSIDLNDRIATHYEAIGQEKVTKEFFPGDHTHTSPEGAKLAAQTVIEGLKSLKECALSGYIRK